jgi:hypothetical protein
VAPPIPDDEDDDVDDDEEDDVDDAPAVPVKPVLFVVPLLLQARKRKSVEERKAMRRMAGP